MFTRKRSSSQRGYVKAGSIAALSWLAFLLLLPIPAYAAITDPDIMQYDSVRLTHNLWEEGDVLLTFEYAISWTDPLNQPEKSANQAFIFRLMDAEETTTLGYSLPYVYVNQGYEAGVGSMYWDADSAPEWDTSYILCLEENPGLDPDPKIVKRAITGADFCPYDKKEDNQKYLRDYLIDAALNMELAWEVEPGSLIGDNNYLTAAGETYFGGAIPGLKVLCPDLFIIQIIVPTVEDTEWTLAHQAATQSQWEGTPWVKNALDGLSELFGGVSWTIITAAGCGIGYLIVLFFSYKQFEEVKPGLLLGMIPLIAGAILGFFPLVALGVICFIPIIFLAYTFWFKQAQ